MLRVIVRQGMAQEVGGTSSFKTIDIDAEELEKYLTDYVGFGTREVIGVEILETKCPS